MRPVHLKYLSLSKTYESGIWENMGPKGNLTNINKGVEIDNLLEFLSTGKIKHKETAYLKLLNETYI